MKIIQTFVVVVLKILLVKEKIVGFFNVQTNFKILKWLYFIGLLILLDMSSKYWIKTHLFCGEVLHVFSYLNYYYVNNAGIAFGLFSKVGLFYRWLFVWITVLIIILFVVELFQSIKYYSRYRCISYSMIIGGAFGNLYDRVLYGTVIDFIDLHIDNWHWPIFNVADIEIFLGINVLLMQHYYIFFNQKVCSK